MNKNKIINDPVYGFVSIPSPLIFDLIAHPYFQRLRFIRQLGVSDFVYPGAVHTRFHHALGAMHLMGRALESLRKKGIDISNAEFEAAQIAILLHDIGHGPLSHSLEETLLHGIQHESLSYLFMKALNKEFDGALDLVLKIFRNSYSRKFFHQLVSSQLDIDRLDYLKRDSFFTGVMEGTIGIDRIIAVLNVHEDRLVVEEKG
ncbi:MAG TPA: HD domain-containing protein, partial [Cyclobacteriaceae bacterium]|nr:HD domain-containing protein [Cyclobacteriaceae bacterium]